MNESDQRRIVSIAHEYVQRMVLTWLTVPMPGTEQQRATVLAQTMIAHAVAQLSECVGNYNASEFLRDSADGLERGPPTTKPSVQ
jgi:hypothetical protein